MRFALCVKQSSIFNLSFLKLNYFIQEWITVWTDYTHTHPPGPLPPHRAPHRLQSRWKTSFSLAAEAAGEPRPSLAPDKAAGPGGKSPLYSQTFRYPGVELETNGSVEVLRNEAEFKGRNSPSKAAAGDHRRKHPRWRDALTSIDELTSVWAPRAPLSTLWTHFLSHWPVPHHTEGANPSLDSLKLAYLRLSLAATGLFNLWTSVRQRLATDRGARATHSCNRGAIAQHLHPVSSEDGLKASNCSINSHGVIFSPTVSATGHVIPAVVNIPLFIEINRGKHKTLLRANRRRDIKKKSLTLDN